MQRGGESVRPIYRDLGRAPRDRDGTPAVVHSPWWCTVSGATGIRPVPTPNWLPVMIENIPRDLADDVAWYPALIRPKRGKVGKWDKIPADPSTAEPATWSDPSTRCTLDVAFMAYQRDDCFAGIGYLMHGNGIVGIDLDACVSPDGTIAQWALDIVKRFSDAYWEISISGTGLRGFCRGELPDGTDGCRMKIEGCSVELYSGQRFLCVTRYGHDRNDGTTATTTPGARRGALPTDHRWSRACTRQGRCNRSHGPHD